MNDVLLHPPAIQLLLIKIFYFMTRPPDPQINYDARRNNSDLRVITLYSSATNNNKQS